MLYQLLGKIRRQKDVALNGSATCSTAAENRKQTRLFALNIKGLSDQ